MYLVDYHIHTSLSADSKATVQDCCHRALALGLREIGFANHLAVGDLDSQTFIPAFLRHSQAVRDCQSKHPSIRIRLGLEVDYERPWEREIRSFLSRIEDALDEPLDFVLGAVHKLRHRRIITEESVRALLLEASPEALFREYFLLLTKAAESRLFDVIAHPDLIRRNSGSAIPHVPFEKYRGVAQEFLRQLLNDGIALEINTKGLRHPICDVYPSRELLELYFSLAETRCQIPLLTLGSDSHEAHDVGSGLQRAAQILSTHGQPQVATFARRKVQLVSASG